MRYTFGSTMFFCVSLCIGLPGAAGQVDVHSHGRPDQVRVRHVDLDLEVDFDRQRIHGHATLTVERMSKDDKQPLVLDSRKLKIEKVETSADGMDFEPGRF